MALQSLTVKEFIDEVLSAMQSSKTVRKSRVNVVFYGKSVQFPIRFQNHELMEKVFNKIRAIEE